MKHSDHVLLRPDRSEQKHLAWGSAFTAIISFVLFYFEWPGAGAFLLLFCALAVIGLLQITTDCSGLELKPRGFECRCLFRRQFHAWDEVSEFRVDRLGPLECVVICLQQTETLKPVEQAFAFPRTTREWALPDTYGMNAVDLANLLNGHRQRNHQ